MTTKRATGANVKFALAMNTGAYGARPAANPAGGWVKAAAYAIGLSKRQDLEDDPLLGQGRDPLPPLRGPIDVTGRNDVPVDKRLFGYWLRLLLGDAVNYGGGVAPAAGARGYLEFTANPADNDTVTLDGVVWTLVAAAPGGTETLIGANLQATLDQLVIDLNLSADPDISAATYSRIGNRLVIEHDTADASGNAYTLAASVAKPSAATLYGGGLYKHIWQSGATSLPDAAVQLEHSDLEGGSARYIVQQGIMCNSLSIARQRSGAAKAEVELIAQSEAAEVASVTGVQDAVAVEPYSQFQGTLLVDDVPVANVTAGNLRIGNNLDVVEALSDDGLIGGADPGVTDLLLSLTSRFSENKLKQAADAAAAISVRFGFLDKADGAELLIELHELHLPTPSREIQGPGGIEVTYEARGAQKIALGRALTVTLYSDLDAY